MKLLWKKHKLLVIGIPCTLLVIIASVIGYLQYQRAKEVKACITMANRYLSELDYEKAIASYTQALDLDAKNKEANLGLAQAYDSNNMYIYAESLYKTMLEEDDAQEEVYEKLADLYIRQEKLEEAKALLEEAVQNVESETIEQLYYITRPEPPSASHQTGVYQDRIKVLLIPSEETQVIYYTLDGTQPTTESFIYEKGIILRNGKTTIKTMVVNTMGYQSDIAVYEYDITVNDILIQIEEPIIETVIRNKLQLSYDEPIYNEDIEQITELYIIGDYLYGSEDTYNILLKEHTFLMDGYEQSVSAWGQIATLKDLAFMPFLERLVVAYQPTLDISALTQGKSLKEVSLVGNQLDNHSMETIGQMTNLTKLNLGWNQISDISSLTGLTNLTSLGIWGNQISDITSVSNLVNLEYLDFSDNQVSTITPITNLTNLKQLWMYSNDIKDISAITGLNNLEVLMLRNNPIENPEEVRSIYPHLTRIDEDLLNLGGN